MTDILALGTNGLPEVKKSISVSTGSSDGSKLVETNPISGKIDDSLIPSAILDGGLTLGSLLEGFIPSNDDSQITDLDSLIRAFEKLQAQVNSRASHLRIEYLTGTSVLSDAQNAAIIDSPVNCNIFLPPGVNNLSYRLRNVGSGSVTFIPNGADKVENQSSYLLLMTNAFDLVFFNGNWYIL